MSTCKAFAQGENYCKDRGISSTYNLEKNPVVTNDWKACMASCTATKDCKAWTFNTANKQCAKKKKGYSFTYQLGQLSGPVEGGIESAKVDCSDKAIADNGYKCDTTILDTHNLGAATFKTSWSECRSGCNGDTACKAYTYTDKGICQKKKEKEYAPGIAPGVIAGPRSGPLAGIPIPGDTASSPTTTAKAEEETVTQTPTPTQPPTEDFFMKKSPFGVAWWIVFAVGLLVLVGSCGMVMVVAMAA